MNRSFESARWAGIAVALVVAMVVSGSAWAQSCDIDTSVIRAIGIEEPWLENAGYLFTRVTDNSSPRAIGLAPEIEARFSDRLGMELDLPAYTAQEPLGRAPSAFGPLAAGLKAVGVHTCSLDEGRATLLTGEIEGQYWTHPRPSVLPGQGDSVTGQAMWAELWNPWFGEGEVGYTRRIGAGIVNGWFFNTSVGRSWSSACSAQLELEVDNQLALADGHRGIEGSVMPQMSYRTSSQWLIAVGEQASLQKGASQTRWSTWLMIEREISDTDDPD